jgi:AcrR family transcriptional regulator
MPNPSKSPERRERFTPLIADAFIELGYRGTTSAELASRCGVRENQLYRVWPTKKAMFLDAVEYVHRATMRAWEAIAAERGGAGAGSIAERILAHQAANHGRMRLYRIVFAALTEDDPDIRAALRNVYRRFHDFIVPRIEEHRATGRGNGRARKGAAPAPESAAWSLIGLGMIVDLQRELDLLPNERRRPLMEEVGRVLLDGASA